MGVTFNQKIRSCGNNCPPLINFNKERPLRAFKLPFKKEYKRYLIQLNFIKLSQKRNQAFCPL